MSSSAVFLGERCRSFIDLAPPSEKGECYLRYLGYHNSLSPLILTLFSFTELYFPMFVNISASL